MRKFVCVFCFMFFLLKAANADIFLEYEKEIDVNSYSEFGSSTALYKNAFFCLGLSYWKDAYQSYWLKMVYFPYEEDRAKWCYQFQYDYMYPEMNNPPMIKQTLFFFDDYACVPDESDSYYKFDLRGNYLGYFPDFSKLTQQEPTPKTIIMKGKEYNLSSLSFLQEQYQDVLYLQDYYVLKANNTITIVNVNDLDIDTIIAPYCRVHVQDMSRVFALNKNLLYFDKKFYRIVDGPALIEERTFFTHQVAYAANEKGWSYAEGNHCYLASSWYAYCFVITDYFPSAVSRTKWELYP